MFIAHFEVEKRSPKVLKFSADSRELKKIKFNVEERKPVVLKFTAKD